MKIEKYIEALMTDFDKILRETFYDVTHLFDHHKAVEDTIKLTYLIITKLLKRL